MPLCGVNVGYRACATIALMSGEHFVDVTYRGLEVGSSARLSEFGPTTAFVEVPQPMPVGTKLTVATDTGFELSASVLRVVEQIAGVEHPGMRVRVEGLEGDAKSWWDAQVTVEDAQIPEPAVETQPLAAEPAPAEEVAAEAAEAEAPPEQAAPQAEAAAEETVPVAAEGVPDPVEDAVTKPNAKKKRSRRKKKEPARTMVMDVAEIQAAIAEGGDNLDADAPAAEMGGNTMKMAAVDIDEIEAAGAPDVPAEAAPAEAEAAPAEDAAADDGDKKKKRKRRRRSRRK